MYRKGKDIRKKRHLAAFVFVPSIFGQNVPTAEFLNDFGRNFLLGNRKKIAKCLMRTFTCRSTFLYISEDFESFGYRLTVFGSTNALSRQLSYAGCTCYTQREERQRERGKKCWREGESKIRRQQKCVAIFQFIPTLC
jgi:hypothetical protein